LIAIDRNIPDNVIDLRQGQWDKKRYARARGLCGRHMGILGVGAIGLAVAERARAFGINLQVLQKEDRSVAVNTQLAALGVEQVPNLDTLLAQCDILSLHLPTSPDNRNMVNAGFLARVQPGTVLLNAARGEIIDESALIAAMDEKDIRVGLDVYADEPAATCAPFTSALAAHPNTYGTHHIGASTDQAQTAVAEGVLEIIDAFGRSEILHCVNGQV
jgi:D-3-phosphoglycerate dehydrogenase